LGGGLAGGAGLHREVQLRQALHRLVVLGDAALEHHHLGVGGVGVGGGGAARDLIGDGHAVPPAVHRPALQLHELVVPVDDAELHLHAQGLGHLAGHVGVKADPLAVLVLVVHGANSVMPTTRVPLSCMYATSLSSAAWPPPELCSPPAVLSVPPASLPAALFWPPQAARDRHRIRARARDTILFIIASFLPNERSQSGGGGPPLPALLHFTTLTQ